MSQIDGTIFLNNSKHIAQCFLQTVVAVDDKMFFVENEEKPAEIEHIEEPDDESGLGEGFINISEKDVPASPLSHNLNFQSLSMAFAKKGIICSGFRPLEKESDSLNAIIQTSKNSDITILDWQMNGQGTAGDLATKAIIKLAEIDKNEGGRLRLIAIYTAEEIEQVKEKLFNALKDDFAPSKGNKYLTFSDKLSHWKIEIISKDVDTEELSSKLIDSFTHLTSGLLSNAALSAITDIRDKTHNILHKFNSSLDPAYLSHVLGLISLPDMREQAHEVAFDYAVDLLSEEIKSELQTSPKIKKSLSNKAIQNWPKYINNKNRNDFFRLKIGTEAPVMFNSDEMKALLSVSNDEELTKVLVDNLRMEEKENISPLKRFKNKAIQLTVNNDDSKPLLELCSIENSRRDINTVGAHFPVLKQGTVLKNKETGKYFVCVQPLCDSIRLSDSASFSLMKISKDSKSFTHVLRNKKNHLKLKIIPTAKAIRTYFFKPDAIKKSVKAIHSDDKLVFIGKHEGFEQEIIFEWCGEFKQTVSQAIVNNLAAQLSRVGFDTFEWLRLRVEER